MPACLLGAGARPRTLAGRRIAQARFEPSPCRRASGFAWPVVKSLLQPCEFRRPPRHESRLCGTRTRLLRRLHEHGLDGYGFRSWIFVSGEARFVSRGLPKTEGWNGAAAFDEGRWRRNVKWKPNRLQFDLQVKTTTRRSSGKAARQAAAFRGRASAPNMSA